MTLASRGARLVDRVRGRELRSLSLRVVEEFGIQNWFAKKSPYERPYAKWVHGRLADLPRDTAIVETGCGIGQNLYLLRQAGFANLMGIEKDEDTAQAARSLLQGEGVDVPVYVDSGEKILEYVEPGRVGVLLNLNWVYFLKPLEELLFQSSEALAPAGSMYVDVIVPHFQPNGAKETRAYEHYPFKYDVAETTAIARRYRLSLAGIYPQNPQYTLEFLKLAR